MNKNPEISSDVTTISIDAEWYKKSFLSVQLATSDDNGSVLDYYVFSDNSDSLKECPSTYKGINVTKVLYPIGKKGVLEYFSALPSKLDCLFFYSPRDLESLLGAEVWTNLLLGGYVNKRRNLNVKPYKLEFHNCKLHFMDLYGRFGCSLEDAYKSVGIDTTNGKDYIEELQVDKSRMDVFRSDYPREFYEYALGDLELHNLGIQLKELMSNVLKECFQLDNVYTSIKDYPATVGNLVNDVFLRYLHKYYPGVLRSCCLLSHTPNNKAAKTLEKYIGWAQDSKDSYRISRLIERDKRLIHGLGMCSIPAFFAGHYGLNDSSPLGAVIQGGRAIKEEPNEHIFKDVLDIDLQSAYGSSLVRFDYPFGLPTVFASPNHRTDRITLKEFLHQYGDELVEGLYTIYISGELSHKQNLVFSKYGLSSDRIGSKVLGGYYDDTEVVESHLGGKFILTSKQIELGIITSDILEVIQKVCSNKEYKDWMNLKVDAAFFYPKSKELSIEEWCKSHSNIHQLGELKSHSDTRSRKWCRISLNEFIGKLVETRLLYKSKRYESSVYDCKQTLLKLIINTFYGDLASPYFSLGQTVLANNITASVRKASWVMANALGCKFIVTDGGIYTPGKVPCFKDGNKSFVKPSISKLFVKDGRYDVSINYTDLIPYSLQDILKEPNAQELLDSLALKHIHKFCNIYGLTFHFKIEHKLSNSGSMAVTNPYGKVDYIIYAYDGEEIIKVRGVQPKEYNRHPKVEFIRALAEGREVKFSGSELIELIGVNQYIRTPNKYGIDLPGEEITVEYIHKPNKKGGYIFETYDDFLKAEHAHKVRISRYEHKYKDVVITLKPRFID